MRMYNMQYTGVSVMYMLCIYMDIHGMEIKWIALWIGIDLR